KAKQQHALRHRGRDGGGCQNRTEHRAYAGSPSESECEADQIGGEGSPALEVPVKAEVSLQPGEMGQPEHEQTEQYDDPAADETCLIPIGLEPLSERSGARPDGDEHCREAEHETQAEVQACDLS